MARRRKLSSTLLVAHSEKMHKKFLCILRRRMMAAIRGKDTKPELAVRRGLHALGFR